MAKEEIRQAQKTSTEDKHRLPTKKWQDKEQSLQHIYPQENTQSIGWPNFIIFTLQILSIFISIVFVFMLSLIVNDDIVGGFIFPTTVFSQTIDNNNNTQLWTDRGNNARIIFTYDPRNPVIGSPTGLLFNVQDLRTGDQIKNIHARIIITNGQKILKIADITSPNGDPSINFAFPDSGPYQIIAKIDSKDIAALSSFKVLVPPQALSTGFKSFSMLMLYYVTPITSVAAGIAVYLVYKRPQDKQTPSWHVRMFLSALQEYAHLDIIRKLYDTSSDPIYAFDNNL